MREAINPASKPPSPNEAESGSEAAKRQRSGHVVHMTGARSQEKGLFSGMKKPLTQPLRIRILSARRIKSGAEAAKRQRSGHVVHMTGA